MTTFQNRILYLDGDEQPITFGRLAGDLSEIESLIKGAKTVVEDICECGHESDLLLVVKAALIHAIEITDNLTPLIYVGPDAETEIRAATELAEAQKKYAAGQEA